MSEKKIAKAPSNPFGPIPDELKPVAAEKRPFDMVREEWVLVPRSKQVGDDPDNIVIEYEAIKKNEIDIQEFINSFADEVGIQNILKKISLTGDTSLLNQTGREPLNPNGGLEPVQDFSNVPKNKTEAFNAVVAGVNAFDNLPEDVKGKLSLTQFVQLFGQDEFDQYIKARVEALQPNVNKGEGENK